MRILFFLSCILLSLIRCAGDDLLPSGSKKCDNVTMEITNDTGQDIDQIVYKGEVESSFQNNLSIIFCNDEYLFGSSEEDPWINFLLINDQDTIYSMTSLYWCATGVEVLPLNEWSISITEIKEISFYDNSKRKIAYFEVR